MPLARLRATLPLHYSPRKVVPHELMVIDGHIVDAKLGAAEALTPCDPGAKSRGS